MRKQPSPDFDRTHWEGLVRTIIDKIGPYRLAEIIDYIADEMLDEKLKQGGFAVETRRVEH
jgi:hypothetical protein